MLIAGGYLLLSEPARSAAEYAQWRQAKTMTLGEKSLIILILLLIPQGHKFRKSSQAAQLSFIACHSGSCCAVRFNLCSDISIIIPAKMNGLGRALGHTNAAPLTKRRIDLGSMLVIDKRHPIRTGPHTG